MKREKYLEIMYKKDKGEDYNNPDVLFKDSDVSVYITHDIVNDVQLLTDKINLLNKGISTSDFDFTEIIKLIEDKNGININKGIVALNYNDLYDSLIESNKLDYFDLSIIYRIEGINNQGIISYLSDIDKPLLDEYEEWGKDRPAPMEDHTLKSVFSSSSGINFKERQKEWHFGFTSKEALNKWFDNEMCNHIINKSDDKAIVVEYLVPSSHTLTTPSQTAFKIKNAKKMKEILLSEYIPKNENKQHKRLKY